MIVNPGIRRFLGSAIQRLFNSASFSAPLTHSLVLARGTGSPTFTRADATNCATFRDWEGWLRTVPSGCARFEGGRMVYNLWTTSSATLANGANKSLTLAAGDYTFSMGAGTGTATFSGTGGATGTLAASASGRVEVTKTITAGTFVVTASVADLVDLQVEYVTGQADQTASEYVSVGVESAPYHGAGVDAIEFFNTDRDGAVIPAATNTGYLAEGARTNLCLQSNAFTTTWTDISSGATQNAIGPDGATSAWTLTDNSAVAAEGIYQNITLTAAAYTWSVFVKKTSGATTYPLMYVGTGTTAALATLDTNNGVATAWTSITGGTILSGVSARCSSYNSLFWRFELTYTGTAAVYFHQLNIASATTPTYAGPTIDVTAQGSAVFYGAQVELGSSASAYIATTTAAVTRAADVLTYPSAGNISNAAGWFSCEASSDNAGASAQADLITDSSGFAIYSRNDLGKLRFYNGTVDVNISDLSVPYDAKRIAATWTDAVAATGAIDGAVPVTVAISGALAIGANLRIGGGVGIPLGGPIKNVRIGQRQLSASEMQAITR